MEVSKDGGEQTMGDSVDFFSQLPMNLSEESSYFMKIHPTSSSQNDAPLVYNFSVDENCYADLSQSYHYVRFKIMKADRTSTIGKTGADNTYAENEKVAPINYYGNTLFSNVELYLNNNLIENSNNLYAYKAYIQAFLSNSTDVKNNQMGVSGYYEDSGDVHTEATRRSMMNEDCANKGLARRFALSKESTPFTSLSPIHLDFCGQNRYLMNKTDVKIRFTRAKPEFALISGTNGEYSIVINESYLLIRMVKPRESLRLAVEESLQNNLALYPMKKSEMRFYTNAGNSQSISEPNLYTGHLPTRVAIALVKTSSLDGTVTESPFYFEHFNVTDMDFKISGKTLTTDPLKIDLTHDDYVLPYSLLYRNTGGLFENDSIISYKQYKNGFFIYVFDLTEDNDNTSSHMHQPQTGTISLDIRVNTPPGVPVSIVAVFEHETVLTCDKDRVFELKQ